jgi:pimeloyl-ACP methyl ester carboxylesterase
MGLFTRILSVLVLACVGFGAQAKPPRIVMEEFMIPTADAADIKLYVRNKHPQGVKKFPADKIVLMVHGATYPAETAFDLKLNGMSWMDYIAGHGYDVYLVDLRGYGRSSLPPEMEQPADLHGPVVRIDVGVRDVGTTADFIRKRRNVAKIDVLGWSWGASIMGMYTTQNNDKVHKLVLYSPQWIRKTAALTDPGTALGAYRIVSEDAAKARWLNGVAKDKQAELIPPGWYEAWAEATFSIDPIGSKQTPRTLRASNGIVQDGRDFWGAGKALYDPGLIRVPTFIAHAEWDADLPSYMLYEYFEKLTNVPYKRYVQIGEGTHTVIMEKNRMQLFSTIQQFLDENFKPGE